MTTRTLAILLLASPALAQVDITPPPAPAEPPPRPTVVETTRPATASRPALSTRPSAESVLQNLLTNPNTPGGSPGASTTSRPATEPPALDIVNGLIPEGALLNSRSGRLVLDADGHPRFHFDPAAQPLPDMPIIPSRRLASLEEASDHGKLPTRFSIDGQITQYRGQNYLYITDSSSDTPAPAATAPSTQPAAPAVAAVAPNAPPAVRIREGEALYNRIGRLVKDEKTGDTLFVFDTDGKQMYDPPMPVVPSRYLAVLEDANAASARPARFRVSARVTQYRGKNYLMLTFVQAIRDLNQGLGD